MTGGVLGGQVDVGTWLYGMGLNQRGEYDQVRSYLQRVRSKGCVQHNAWRDACADSLRNGVQIDGYVHPDPVSLLWPKSMQRADDTLCQARAPAPAAEVGAVDGGTVMAQRSFELAMVSQMQATAPAVVAGHDPGIIADIEALNDRIWAAVQDYGRGG